MFNRLFVAIAASFMSVPACAIVARNVEICAGADQYVSREGWNFNYKDCPQLHDREDSDNWIDLNIRRCESNRVWHIHTECLISPFNGKIAGYFIGHTPSTGWKLCAPFGLKTMGDHLSAYWLRRVANILRVSAEELGRQICDVHDTDTEDHWVNMTRKSGRSASTYTVTVEHDGDDRQLIVKVWHSLNDQPVGPQEILLDAKI